MIDLRVLRDTPDVVRASQRLRGDDPSLVDQALELDARRRAALTEFEQRRAEQKSLGKQVAGAQGDAKAELLARAKALAEQVKTAQADADAAAAELEAVTARLGNVVLDGVPEGGEDDYVVLREVGSPRDFGAEYGDGFRVRDHLELGELLGAIDTERGAKVSGARFYFLTGIGARLELALLNAAMDRALAAGFTPMITPTLVRPEVMAGTGYLGAHADEVYRLEADDLYLVGTSEVALAGYHTGEILDLADGPVRYAGWSACYRREAGSYGKDTRGIIRVHQFHKVEMFSFASADDAAAEHERLLALEEEMLALVGLPYRVIDTAAGDLGSSAARKFDCEAWLPSQGRWLELTSTSNCTTFQARRLGVRERTADGETRVAATLNGTLGTTRWIVALLENHQLEDGSVRVPEGLRPYLGGLDVLRPDGPAGRPWTPLLVALDIDGTLLTYDGALDPEVADAVGAVRDAGHHVVLATGRSVHATVPVADLLGLRDGWAVSSNGSVTVRLDPSAPEGYEVTEVITFDPAPALHLLHQEFPDALFAVEEVGRGFRMNRPFPDGELDGEHEIVDMASLAGRHVTRLIVRSPGHTSERFRELVAQTGLADVTYAIGWTAWMDVAPAGVTKASALEQVRVKLGVDEARTVALGDGSNDVEMLRWAARGVAMGHAEARVLDAADEVTAPVTDGGAVRVLRSLLDA